MRLTNVCVIAGVIVLSLSVVAADAQGRRGGARGGGGGRGAAISMDEQGTLLLLTALLDLTDAQRQQVRAVFDAAVEATRPLAAQATARADAIFQAVKSASSDDQIRQLVEQHGALTSQILAVQAQTFSKVWNLLTDVQKAKFDASMYADIGTFLSHPTTAPSPATPGAPPSVR
jgi:Spy/CpxP family protein refolding chaperone